jgi:hypothetical protein
MISEVAVPAGQSLKDSQLTTFLFAFMEFAGSWDKSDIKSLGKQISAIVWLPTEDGSVCAIGDCFDPKESPEAFTIVKKKRVKIAALMKEIGVSAETVWKVLRLCGIKVQITWEDALEEADSIMKEKDVKRASHLYTHLDKHHVDLKGSRAAVLPQLQKLAWVPATKPTINPADLKGEQLLTLAEVFPRAETKLVWAVAATLSVDEEPTWEDLKVGKSVEKEPLILTQQLNALLCR